MMIEEEVVVGPPVTTSFRSRSRRRPDLYRRLHVHLLLRVRAQRRAAVRAAAGAIGVTNPTLSAARRRPQTVEQAAPAEQ